MFSGTLIMEFNMTLERTYLSEYGLYYIGTTYRSSCNNQDVAAKYDMLRWDRDNDILMAVF
jgi:hypothetical protein